MGQKVYTNRKFRLLAENERDNVDLREYKVIIENTIQEIAPNTRITVRRDYYMLDCVTQSQIVQIGRLLAKTEINKHSAIVPIFRLFEGYDGKRIKGE